MKKNRSRLGKIVFASAIAFGGLVVLDSAKTSLGVEAATKADLYQKYWADYGSNTKDALSTKVEVSTDSSDYRIIEDFTKKHNPLFSIHNTSGTIVQRGSLNMWMKKPYGNYNDIEFESFTNINLSALSPGHYRIKVTIPMDDGSLTHVDNSDLTQAFTIQPDRSIVDFRP
ncbi:hypothetical protein [Bacillus sp. REN10]|uniref:hypothetical protein n=1 Tax=Bacillus sp. REN10 TaxID=2782541 RepID=UPI00193C6893|nr:hypothetical protein [Bacillus sp. REN10]